MQRLKFNARKLNETGLTKENLTEMSESSSKFAKITPFSRIRTISSDLKPQDIRHEKRFT